jgi:hypothetical protein
MKAKLKKIGIAATIAVVIVGAGYYLASPYLAIQSIRRNFLEKNVDQLTKYIDYPALRENIKPQMGTIVLEYMKNDPSLDGNPFANLADFFVGPMVNSMVDEYVSPSGLEIFIDIEIPDANENQETQNSIVAQGSFEKALDEISMGYNDLNNFQATLTTDDDREFHLLFNREGFATWKLKSVILPQP